MSPGVPRACLTFVVAATLVVQADDSRWISWIRDNHHTIEQPAAGVTDEYADLQFLKEVIGGRRIVQIGESHHSVAEYGAVKTRLHRARLALRTLIERELSATVGRTPSGTIPRGGEGPAAKGS